MIGYGLDKDSAIWWNRTEIFRYGPNHADSLNYHYGDVLDVSIIRSLDHINKNTIVNFSKITINNI